MSNQYSQIIAPFKRVTNTPLEYDLLFSSVDELYSWAKENKNVLHEGLVKVTTDCTDPANPTLTFWSFVKVSAANTDDMKIEVGTTIFSLKKIISSTDIESLVATDNESSDDIKAINDQIDAIWGVQEEAQLDEKLNSISKLIEAIKMIRQNLRGKETDINDLFANDRAITGCYDGSIITYLEGLSYNSITAINRKLVSFFDTTDKDDTSINNWRDVVDFLAGYTDQKPLKQIIDEITGGAIEFKDTQTITFDRLELKSNVRVEASVNISQNENNQIILKNDGLFHSVDIRENGTNIEFYVNDNLKRNIDLSKFLLSISDIYYNHNNETLIIEYQLPDKSTRKVRIPMSQIIREWECKNEETEPVKLQLTAAVGEGRDKLQAVLEVNTDPNNILQKTSAGLFVGGIASNIKYDNTTVAEVLARLDRDMSKVDEILDMSIVVDTLKKTIEEMDEDMKALEDKNKELEEKLTQQNWTIQDLTRNVEDLKKLIEEHIADKENPHEVTPEQLDVYTKAEVDEMHTWIED